MHLFTGTHHGEEAGTLRNGDFSGTRLDSLQTLKYCSYVQKNNGQQAPFLSLEIDANNDGTLDDRLFFEPPYQTPSTGNPSLPDQGAVQLFTWQCWDVLAGGWWANSGDGGLDPGSGVKPLSAYLAAHPERRPAQQAGRYRSDPPRGRLHRAAGHAQRQRRPLRRSRRKPSTGSTTSSRWSR